MSEDVSFVSETYLAVKSLWKGKRYRASKKQREQRKGSVPYAKGRDPRSLGDVISLMSKDLGWNAQLNQSLLISEWDDFVGADIAQHTTLMSIEGSILHVQCDSTAWATQLRRMRFQIVTKISEQYPDAGIEDITFHGPHVPSWRHGIRSVPGRGPRDTYG